jgi:hypothetical protein
MGEIVVAMDFVSVILDGSQFFERIFEELRNYTIDFFVKWCMM